VLYLVIGGRSSFMSLDPVVPAPSPFASALAQMAVSQLNTYQHQEETTPCSAAVPCLAHQIASYWHDLHNQDPNIPQSQPVSVPWSAVFISWCVLQASGAQPVAFKYSPQHSVFVNAAINHPAAFKGHAIDAYAPRVGDIIANNRSNQNFDFAYASTHGNYESHSRIVVAKGMDSGGKYVSVIGGNENDTGSGGIHMHRLSLHQDGSLIQVAHSSFIAVLQNLA